MVKPGGTGSPARVISATPAPLPPSRSRIEASPSSNSQTHFVPRAARVGAEAGFFAAATGARETVARTTAAGAPPEARAAGLFEAALPACPRDCPAAARAGARVEVVDLFACPRAWPAGAG